MKFLLLIFFAGLSLAAAGHIFPLSFYTDVQIYDDGGELREEIAGAVSDEDEAKSLRKRMEELMETVKNYRDSDQEVPRDILLELKNVFDIMERKNIQLTTVEEMVKWAVHYYLKNPQSSLLHSLSAEDDLKNELGKVLKKHLEEILEKVRDIIDNGKAYKEDLAQKLKEIAQKLKDIHVDIGDHAKDLLNQLKDKAKDYWKKILDKITPGRSDVLFAVDPEVKAKLGDKLREKFDRIRGILRDIFENGKSYKGELVKKMKDIWEKLRNIGEDISEEAKEDLEKLKEKARDYWRKILDKLNPDNKVSFAEGDDLAKNLRERFEELLEKIKDAIENKKVLGGNVVAKLRDIYKEMKEKSIPFGDKIKELVEQMKEKATGIWKRILDKINPSKRSVEARGAGAENLRERLQELLEKLRESFRDRKLPGKGFISKLRQIRDEMREKNVPLGGKLKEMIEKLKENANGVWRRILDRIGSHGPETTYEIDVLYGTGAENLRDRLEELLEKLRESFRDHKLPGKGFISKLRQIRDEMREKKVPLGGKLKEMIEKLKENANGVWRRILDRIGSHGPETTYEIDVYHEDPKTELGKALKKHLEEILDKIKDIIDNGKAYKDDLVEKAKEIAQKLKDMKVDIGDHAKKVLKDLKEKAKDYWKKVLDKLSFDSEINVQVYMEEPKSELAKILKKHYEEILETLKDIIENGRTYKDDLVEKAKEIAQKLKDMKVDIGDHARQVLKDLKEKAKDYWRKILDRLNL